MTQCNQSTSTVARTGDAPQQLVGQTARRFLEKYKEAFFKKNGETKATRSGTGRRLRRHCAQVGSNLATMH